MARRQPLSHRARGPRRGAGFLRRGAAARRAGGRAHMRGGRRAGLRPLRPRGRARGGGVFRGLRPRDAPHTRGARPHRRGDTVRADALYRAGIRRRAARGGRRRRNREPARALRRRPHGARRGLRPLRADPRARPRGRIRLHGRGQPRAIPPPPRASREARRHIRERLREARPRARGGPCRRPEALACRLVDPRGAPREAAPRAHRRALRPRGAHGRRARLGGGGARIGRAPHGPARAAARARNCEKRPRRPPAAPD